MRTASTLGLLLCIIGCAGQERPDQAPAPRGALELDARNPLITAMIAGRPLRLRVDLAQSETIELDPAIADRLALHWTPGRDLEIGRVALSGRTAETRLEANGQRRAVLVSTHGRPIGAGMDGLIGPDLLPYATILWRRADAPPADAMLTLPLAIDPGIGLIAHDPRLPLPIRLRFTFQREASEATAAAGSMLAQHYGGHFDGGAQEMPVFLGVARPARPLAFDRTATIAGFRFARLGIRIADFRGGNPLPADRTTGDEIVVARREAPQPAQSWVTIANDRLRHCAEVTYAARPRSLTLACAFDPAR